LKENSDDMHSKSRWIQPIVPQGEHCNLAKLSESQVLAIIERLLVGETRTRIAHDFNVTISAVSRIAVGSNWKHLTAGRGIVKSTRGVKRGDR